MRRGNLLSSVIVFVLLTCPVASARSGGHSVFLAGSWIDSHHRYGWSVSARRPAPPEGSGPHGAQRPCILVSSIRTEFGGFSVGGAELCYGVPGFLSAKAEPLVVAINVFSSQKGSATAFGVAAPPAARLLRLTLSHGYRTLRLHALNDVQARKARLRPFRYAGFVMRGEWCIERYEVLNEVGNTLWDSGLDSCVDEGGAESTDLRGGVKRLGAVGSRDSPELGIPTGSEFL